MSGAPRGNGGVLLVAAMLAATAFAVLEFAGLTDGRGALLLTLALWTAIAQGSVAVVAAAEITGARWVAALKPELLASARLLPFLAVLFAFAWPRLELYGWAASPGAWLNRPFFFARSLLLLAACAVVALRFARRALEGRPAARRLAVAYLLLFVACQSLVAFDWIMSLSYPWVSSMLGLYFFVEALYAGLAAAGLLFLLRHRRGDGGAERARARRDGALLLFGFSVLWGGLFFAQFVLLWYGNLPEEVSFIATRLASSPTRELIPAFLVACFGVPFVVLLPARSKRSVATVALVSAVVLLGLAAERLLLVLPSLPIGPGVLLLENLLAAAVWGTAIRGSVPPGEPALASPP